MRKVSKYRWVILAIAATLITVVTILVGCAGKRGASLLDEDILTIIKQKPLGEPSSHTTTSVVVGGRIKGGEVTMLLPNSAVTVVTSPNESTTSVVERLIAAINANSVLREQGINAQVNSDQIMLANVAEHQVSLCTTDEGLRVPQEPQQLSCTVNPEEGTVVFQWQNPEEVYDRIHIEELLVPRAQNLPGAITNFTYNYRDSISGRPFYTGIHTYHVIGWIDRTPSCTSTCEVFLPAP
jgi:hypothetical protein